MRSPGRVLAVVLGVVLALAVVAAVVASLRSAPDLEEGSPEAAVQAFVAAALRGDSDAAARVLDPDGPCTAADVDEHAAADPGRVVLADSTVTGDTARVEVQLVWEGPFETDSYRETHVYRLVRSEGTWLIQGVPWPLYHCEGDRP